MFRCPLCGASARIRTSRPENDSNTVRQKYYQCNNLECGVCFSTLEAFHKFTSKHASPIHSSEGIPLDLPYISRHLLSLNPLQARCRRYSRGER